MKRFYLLNLLVFGAMLFSCPQYAQGLEDFENTTVPDNTDSFTRGGITFTSSSTNFDWTTFNNAGAGDSDRFFDNFGFTATGASYTISSGGALFTMLSAEFYLSADANAALPTANAGAHIRIRGIEGGQEVFTSLKTSGFPTTLVDPGNGFFLYDFTAAPGAGDVSSINVDTIEITLIGDFRYIALDNFNFGAESLETDPPFVQSISIVGSPFSTADSVDFLVNFNENANNISIDDFLLDAVGTTGTITNVSNASGTSTTVSVTGISGEGTLSIDLNGVNDIADDLGNSPVPAFAGGEIHTVSRCFQEPFESFISGDFMFASNGVNFTTSTANFSVETFVGGGVSSSDRLLSNTTDQGVNKVYSINTTGPEQFNVEALYAYVSSEADGANPTGDGTITFRGKLGGSILYTITKNSNFPINFNDVAGVFDNGFSFIDFATEGASDFSLTNIDELEIELGGAFIYLAIDDFEHCEQVNNATPPIVQSISLIGDPNANAATVDYTVIFNENAINVTLDDFFLTTTGSSVGSLTGITGSGNNYIVTVSAISGEGSIRLDLSAGTNIEDVDGNTPPDPFTSGEVHLTSICQIETFEALAVDATEFVRDAIPFSTGTANFNVEEFIGGGAGGSDRFLSNLSDQGVNKTYSIGITDASVILMNTLEVYVSSESNGDNPTNDGTLTINGKLNGNSVYSFSKSSGFPTTFGTTSGFITLDFATDGASDFTGIDVDEIEIQTGGAFVYIAVDNFKFCIDPTVNYVWDVNAWSPTDPNGVATFFDTITILDTVNPATLTADTNIDDITINPGATLSMGSFVLSVSGDILNNGSLDADSGASLRFFGNEAQALSGSGETQIFNGVVNNSSGVVLNQPVDVKSGGLLTLVSGTLTTNDHLTFKSDVIGTGELDIIPASGTTISGNVTVERFIPARRAFRFLSSAVNTSTTIQANWQEGGTNAQDNPNPGFGTHITGSTTGANGFDMTATGNPSMFTLNNVSQVFEAIPNTDTDVLNAGIPYRIFIRGSRAVDLTTNSPTPDNTTLRATGTLSIGNVTESNLSQAAGAFNFIGNPYQSSVNMIDVLANSTNINTSQYYIWDPNLGERGQYVTILLPAGTNMSGSDGNQYLQPAQGAFVTTLVNGAASILFEETDKAPGNSTMVFDPTINDPITDNARIIGQLYRTEAFDNGDTMQDSFGILFSENFTNDLTPQDAVKPINVDENLGILQGESFLSIERRALPEEQDIVPLFIGNYKSDNYTLIIETQELDQETFLVDNFTDEYIELLEGENVINFLIDEEDESSDTNRFQIAFTREVLSTQSFEAIDVMMYPNPLGDERLTITGLQLTSPTAQLKIVSLLGQTLVDTKVNTQGSTITTNALTSLPQGIYLVSLVTTNQSITKRIVKK